MHERERHHAGSIYCVSFNTSGNSGSSACLFERNDCAKPSPNNYNDVKTESEPVLRVLGTLLATGSNDKTVRVLRLHCHNKVSPACAFVSKTRDQHVICMCICVHVYMFTCVSF